MTTINLSAPMRAMLERAAARPEGTVETRHQTAVALRARGLVTVTHLSSGRTGVHITVEGRQALSPTAEVAPLPPLITWEIGNYGIWTGAINGVELFEVARSTNRHFPDVYHLGSQTVRTVISLPIEGFGSAEGAQAAAEVLFRKFAAKLGLTPIGEDPHAVATD